MLLFQVEAQNVNVIPQPVEVLQNEGTFHFTSITRLSFNISDKDLAEVVELLREQRISTVF